MIDEEQSQDVVWDSADRSLDVIQEEIDELLSVASVANVYAEPILHNGTLIIPAAEVVAGLGFGVGSGSGPATDKMPASGGAGGGGGGRTFARPVAVIVSSPEGVHVEPVYDRTKVLMTALTAFGFMFAMMMRMSRRHRRPPTMM